MTDSFDVIVVGGGIVGAACARELAETGRRVLLLDRGGDEGDAWHAAAGMLSAQVGVLQDDPLFELGIAGRERYAELAPVLLERTGIDIGFWQEGITRLAADDADAAQLRSQVAWQRQQGHVCDWFDGAEVKRRWPWVGPTSGALFASRDAALHPIRLVEALLKDAVRLGVTVVTDRALSIVRRGNRVSGVLAREQYAAGAVVIAAGAWSGRLAGLPRPLSVEPVRGQMAAMQWPTGTPRAVVVGRNAYVVERDGEAIIGSTMEPVGYSTEVTAAGLAEIFTGVSALIPTLARGEVLRTWAGLRPVTPDGLPVVGAEPRLEGLWYATGHGRNGVLLAGITGLILAQLMNGENEVERIAALRPERFWEW
ncbi:MAG: glycine oxidase ThiO [Gemmatimonadales bacterium]